MLLFGPVFVGSLVLVYHIMWMLCHDRMFTDCHVSGIPALDRPLWDDPLSPTPFSQLPHTALNIVIIDCFYIVLFCALRQILCAHVACDAKTCHLHFWQIDWNLLYICAAAVKQEWNRYWSKSQHRKLTFKGNFFLLLQRGLEFGTFQSWVQCFNTELFLLH